MFLKGQKILNNHNDITLNYRFQVLRF